MVRVRLDRLLVDRGLVQTRERARAIILAGHVLVDDSRIDKAGHLLSPDALVRLVGEDHPYVSRGGLKLKGALDTFGIRVEGMIVLDVGASTGGFTDCLLQEGARKVYALDVGYGQLAWRLRQDPRVVCIERMNIRNYTGEGMVDTLDMAAIDTSFISLKLVIPAVIKLLRDEGFLIALIKPQFEVGRGEVGKGGVVRNPDLHERVLDDISSFCSREGLGVYGTCESPLIGPAGNREFFIYAGIK
ncbi:MAG: TlyA family RNA methyltransferase [Syntrophales bacterium]|jgi:23S rRNA (cytidine1920-2'-O)/16S rRNA (cytidine1409-2'-O)-methyltransferase